MCGRFSYLGYVVSSDSIQNAGVQNFLFGVFGLKNDSNHDLRFMDEGNAGVCGKQMCGDFVYMHGECG